MAQCRCRQACGCRQRRSPKRYAPFLQPCNVGGRLCAVLACVRFPLDRFPFLASALAALTLSRPGRGRRAEPGVRADLCLSTCPRRPSRRLVSQASNPSHPLSLPDMRAANAGAAASSSAYAAAYSGGSLKHTLSKKESHKQKMAASTDKQVSARSLRNQMPATQPRVPLARNSAHISLSRGADLTKRLSSLLPDRGRCG